MLDEFYLFQMYLGTPLWLQVLVGTIALVWFGAMVFRGFSSYFREEE